MGAEKIDRSKAWMIAFWIILSLSALWLLLSLAIWPQSWFALIQQRFLRAPSGALVNLAISLIFLVQPPILVWLIYRAIRGRLRASPLRRLMNAALPLTTFLLVAGLMTIGNVLEERALARHMIRQTTGSISYFCEKNHSHVDFHRNAVRSIHMILTAHRSIDHPTRWIIETPTTWSGPVDTFRADTGSIGGSQGIQWHDRQGKTFSATLSFSDIYGEFGTETIWLRMKQSSDRDFRREDDPAYVDMTCGPEPSSYREAGQKALPSQEPNGPQT